ncbi:hypothetical protein ACLOJK_019938 [Asimina triloba]
MDNRADEVEKRASDNDPWAAIRLRRSGSIVLNRTSFKSYSVIMILTQFRSGLLERCRWEKDRCLGQERCSPRTGFLFPITGMLFTQDRNAWEKESEDRTLMVNQHMEGMEGLIRDIGQEIVGHAQASERCMEEMDGSIRTLG